MMTNDELIEKLENNVIDYDEIQEDILNSARELVEKYSIIKEYDNVNVLGSLGRDFNVMMENLSVEMTKFK